MIFAADTGRIRRKALGAAAGLAVLLLRAPLGYSQTWLYSGTDYGTATNWSTGVVPGAGQTATFSAGGANQPVVAGNFTIGTVNMTAGSLAINSGRTLTVQTAYNLADASILGPGTLSLGAGSLLTAGGSSADLVSAVVAGSGAVTISGSTVTFTAANSYTGTTTVNAGGTLQVGAGGATGQLGTGAVTDNGALVFNRSAALTVANAISGSGSLTQAGTGTIILTGNNSYAGITSINAGSTLQVGNGGATGSLGSGDVVDNGTLTFNRSDTLTVANAISGTGALIQAGSGTTILTGTNSYAGTTTINAGTLQVGNGGTTGSLGTGNVTNNGTLAFNRADTLTVANAISGTGALVQAGSGTLVLTAANTYTGPTTVTAGLLKVAGSITSNVTVGPSGSLGGTGTIAGNVVVNGFIQPDIGTLNIAGTYTQNPGSTYRVEVTPSGQSDLINITGNAVLNGGTVSVTANSGSYGRNTTYTILKATGTVSGSYAGVTSNLAFLTPGLSYDANDVFLTLSQSSSAFEAGGVTPNQKAVGAALDRASPTASGDFATVLSALSGLTTAQGPAALDAISGVDYAGFQTLAVQNARAFMNLFTERAGGASHGYGRVALAEACAVACDVPAEPRWSAWGGGLGGVGTIAGDANTFGYSYSLGGLAAGLDYGFDPRVRAGAAVGYTSSTLYTQGLPNQGTANAVSIALYGQFADGPVYLDGLAGYARGQNQMKRQILIPGLAARTAQGSTTADQFFGLLEGGYRIALDDGPANAALTPFARLQGSTTTQAAFSETGADSLDLGVAQQTTNSLRTVLGGQLSGDIAKVNLRLQLGWSHEFADPSRPVTASFAGAPAITFTTLGAATPRDGATVGLMATATLAESISFYARYDGELQGGTTSNVFFAGLRIVW
ncbi:MAG TPA: autotransporter domain-containing protein [Reyranella sp.]